MVTRRFSLDDFRKHARGVARVEENVDGSVALKRMTADLEKFYSYSEGALIRANCMPGVRLCFASDASQLRLKVKYGGRARDFFKLHCLVDHQFQEDGPDEFQAEAELCFNAPDNGSLKEFELYFPHCCEVAVSALELVGGSALVPVEPKEKTWLLIGDSISQGMTATGPTFTFASITAAVLGLEQHNIAVGGAVMAGELGELVKPLAGHLVTVAFGTNDFNGSRPLSEFRDQSIRLLDELVKRVDSKIVLLTPVPWAGRTEPNASNLQLEEYREVLRQLVPAYPQTLLLEGPEIIPDDQEMFCDDVHPNNRGMQVYAANLTARLKGFL